MPLQFDDRKREFEFLSPLGADLVVHSMSGKEELGRLYEFQLGLLSTRDDIPFTDIVGERVTVVLHHHGGKRYFDGYVTEFRFTGREEASFAMYEATVRPWLWFLTRTADCRIFQQGIDNVRTVPDIIKSVFRDNGMTDFDDRLTGHYRDWIYCVQYRESDFNFVSRLMEQEGIYYFFEHAEGKHTLVLADAASAHKPDDNFQKVPFSPPTGAVARHRDDVIHHWSVTQSIIPQRYTLAEYDFEKPKVELLSKLNKDRGHAYPISDAEIFDYPGEYTEARDGDNYAELRLHEMQSQFERFHGEGPIRGLAAGFLFTLEEHPRADQNREYLAVSVIHNLKDDSYFSNPGGGSEVYYCQIEVMNSAEVFRPARTTPKPIVQGLQPALVVGPSSEEIYCDKYGRVKVQFYWDRYGKKDENSSCWIRVSQSWAGKEWGSIHIPRIGHEVLVSFLEGDPDQPIITGRVYNADNMPPYSLEANKTQSGIKSRSSKGGSPSNFNEIRMDDKKGEEELYIQAEKNQTILVKYDKKETVQHDETIGITNDRKEKVGNNETLEIAVDRTVSVGANQKISVGADQTISVSANESKSISANRKLSVGGNETVSVTGKSDVSVTGNQKTSVTGNRDVSVLGPAKLTTSATYDVSAAAPINITSAVSITLSAGACTVTIGPASVDISAPMINVTGSGLVNIVGGVVKVNS